MTEGHGISSFSVAMVKHHDQVIWHKMRVYLGLWFWRGELIMVKKHGRKYLEMGRSSTLRVEIFKLQAGCKENKVEVDEFYKP